MQDYHSSEEGGCSSACLRLNLTLESGVKMQEVLDFEHVFSQISRFSLSVKITREQN